MSDNEDRVPPEDDVQEVPLDDEEPAASDNGSDAEQPEDDTTVAPVPGAAEEETAEEAAPEPAAEPEEAKPAKEAKGDVFGGGDDDDLFGGEPEEEEAPVVPESKPEPAPVAAPEPASEPEVKKPVENPLAAPAKASPPPAAEAAAPPSPVKSASKRSTSSSTAAEEGNKHVLEVTVSKPSRIGDGMSSYMVYHVHTKTNMPSFTMSDVEVQHRYSDFHNLYKYLVESYQGVIVPMCPPKDAVGTGMMKFKSQGEEITPFVERRGAGLERFLQRIAAHPALRKDDLVKTFLTTENKMPKPKSNALANIAAKLTTFIESDEWYADKTQEIDALEGQLKKLHAALESLVKRRKELSAHTTLFAESFGALADAEELESLQKAMHQMADVEVKVARLHSKQEHRDFYHLSEIAFDYLQMIHAVKTCFHQRISAYRTWQSAESTLVKKKEAEANYTARNRVEKLDQAAREVTEAEEIVTQAHENFDTISARLKKELKRFDIVRAHDFTHSMVEYVESMMTLQHQIVKAWEAFLPEAKCIGQ